MTDALSVRDLRKRYGDREVLRGVDLAVPTGEIFALLGANGAGKTTTLECIEGLRSYNSGRIELSGTIGVQLQSASLPGHIRGREALNLFARWNGVRPDAAMLAALGSVDLWRKQYRTMSTGQKRRLHLALALLKNPDIVILDEPTAGLDVEGRIILHDYIRHLKQEGRTIILASHDMAEVEELCDRIAILRDGQVVFSGTTQELREQVGSRYRVRISTAGGTDEYTVDGDVAPGLISILEDYKKRNVTVRDVSADRGSLEEHLVRIAREEAS